MHTEPARDPHFEALKDLTRLSWLLNFEALASVVHGEDAVMEGLV